MSTSERGCTTTSPDGGRRRTLWLRKRENLDYIVTVLITTGEGGNYGKTLFPDRDGLQNSRTNNKEIYLHPSLTKVVASEAFSHEGYGHALLYIRTGGNHQRASHIFQTSPFGPYDANTVLSNMIRSSRRSTIQNLI